MATSILPPVGGDPKPDWSDLIYDESGVLVGRVTPLRDRCRGKTIFEAALDAAEALYKTQGGDQYAPERELSDDVDFARWGPSFKNKRTTEVIVVREPNGKGSDRNPIIVDL